MLQPNILMSENYEVVFEARQKCVQSL